MGHRRRDAAADDNDAVSGCRTASTAAAGLLYHRKHDLLDKTAIRATARWGVAAAIAGALLSTVVDTALLHRPFGIYLIIMGAITLFHKEK